jgi:hypothetical protein
MRSDGGDLCRGAPQFAQGIAAEILVAEYDRAPAGRPIAGFLQIVAIAAAAEERDHLRVVELLAHELGQFPFFAVGVFGVLLQGVVGGDERIVGIAHDGDEVRRDRGDEIRQVGCIVVVLMEDRVIGKAVPPQPGAKRLELRALGGFEGAQPTQAVDAAEETLEPHVAGFRRTGDNDPHGRVFTSGVLVAETRDIRGVPVAQDGEMGA